jgi:hypothetical protein
VTCLNKYSLSIYSTYQMILTCVSYDVIKYVVIISSNKNEFKIIYCNNVVMCIKTDAKTYTSRLTLA